ncbi:MAG: hypothetical protein ACI30X_02055 [Muribaculaceae bacterium]
MESARIILRRWTLDDADALFRSDLIVYRTDREYRAGWKNEAKRYLLY